jgi:large subunit ribosomal protein L15
MALSLHTIRPNKGAKKSRKRVGRGDASCGTYSGRGLKGQRSRSGGKAGLKRKGMQRIILSMPKQKGFKSGRPNAEPVNVTDIAKSFVEGAKVTPLALKQKGLVTKTQNGVKVLGRGNIGIKITLTGCAVSASAKEKIEKAGGTVVIK